MIYQDIQITVNQGLAVPDKGLYIFRGDSNIILNFKLVTPQYMLTKDNKDVLVSRFGVDNFELRLQLEKGYDKIIKGVITEDGCCRTQLTQNAIQELRTGTYSYQITLIDDDANAIMTFPVCKAKLNILDRMSLTAEELAIPPGLTGEAMTNLSLIADDGEVLQAFDSNGNYIKTDWKSGDLISANRLDKIEDAIDKINQNEKRDVAALDEKVTNNFNVLDSTKMNASDKIKSSQLDTSSNAHKIQQVNLSEEVKEMMAGNTPINAEVADGGVTTEKYADNSIILEKMKFFYGIGLVGNLNREYMNFDMVNKKVIFPPHCYITLGGETRIHYNGGDETLEVPFDGLGYGERSLVYDLSDKSFKVVTFYASDLKFKDKYIFIASWWSNDAPPILTASPHFVNGKKVDMYGDFIKTMTINDIEGDIPLNRVQNVARNAFIGGYNDGINFDFNNKQVIIPKFTYIMVDTNTSGVDYLKEDVIIDISGGITTDGFRYLVYDTSDKTYKVIYSNKGSKMTRNMHTIATWWSNDGEAGLWCHVPKYLVNGKKPNRDLDPIKLTQLTHAPRNIFMGNALGNTINFDFTNKEIVIPRYCYITINNSRIGYNGDDEIKISWANSGADTRYFVYDLDSGTYKVVINGDLTHNMLFIATWWSHDDPNTLTCYVPQYKVNGEATKITREELNNALESIEVGDSLQGFNETINIPLYKSKLFLFEGINMPFFFDSTFMGMKSSMIKALNPVLTYIDDKDSTVFNDAGLSPLINTSHFGGNKVSIRYNAGVHGVHYERTIDAVYRKQDNVTNKNPKILMIGDSLTEWGTPHYTKQILQRVGIQPNMIGTFKDYMNVPCEGKGSWTWTNYIGRNTKWGVNDKAITPATGNTSTGDSCPFWKEATAEDKANHPDWCFKYTGKNSNEESYAEATDKSGTFYIFDMEYYLSKLSGQVPDAISIALGTNDLNISYLWNKDVYELMELSLEIMLTQIRKVLPNTPIAIIPVPVRGAYNETAWNLNDKYAIWYSRCVDKVNSLGFNNVDILSIYAHMSRDYVWGLNDASCVELNHGVKKNVDGDTTHFRELGQRQFGAVTASYFGNVIE